MKPVNHILECKEFASPQHFVKAFRFDKFPTSLHDHDFYEIIIVSQGKGHHKIGNSIVPIQSGDVFVIPPLIPHALFDSKDLNVTHILLKTEFIKERQKKSASFPGYHQLMEIEPFLRQNYYKSMFLHLNSKQLWELQQDIKYIESINPLYHPRYFELQYHVTWKIIYFLSYLFDKQLNTKKETNFSKYEAQILDTLEYIHKNFSEKISIELLANRVFLSKSTFLRNFQFVCGCSPIQYLNKHRIKKAEELLDSSTMSKTEIAHACGFYDLSHMEKYIGTNRTTIHD